jgi:hypothetical protein
VALLVGADVDVCLSVSCMGLSAMRSIALREDLNYFAISTFKPDKC